MNNLSWMLYLASVSDRVSGILGFTCVFSVILFIIWVLTGICAANEDAEREFWPFWRKFGLLIVPVFFLSFILNAVIPSKETVYAIAASEMGEQALKTPLAGKAEKALESWLDKQTQENSNAR